MVTSIVNTLTGTATTDQSGPGGNGDEGLSHIYPKLQYWSPMV